MTLLLDFTGGQPLTPAIADLSAKAAQPFETIATLLEDRGIPYSTSWKDGISHGISIYLMGRTRQGTFLIQTENGTNFELARQGISRPMAIEQIIDFVKSQSSPPAQMPGNAPAPR